MKPLLRAVLLIDAVLLAAFGVLFVLTPWKALYDALQLVTVDPAMVGQAFGIALLGLAWLSVHAAFNGDLTAGVARAVGHVNWLTGVVMLVWLLAVRSPQLSSFGQFVSVVAGAVLLVIGFGGVRLAAAVRRREKARGADARGASKRAAQPVMAPPAAARIEPGVSRVSTAPGAPAAASAASAAPAAVEKRRRKNIGNISLFFFKQKTAYEIASCLVGSEMCMRGSGATAVATVIGAVFRPVRPPRFAAARSPRYIFDAAPRALLLLFPCSFPRPLPCTTKS